MTKNELAKLVLSDKEYKDCDMALPQYFVDKIGDDFNIDPRGFYVWLYTDIDKVIGKPVDLAKRFYQMYQDAPKLFTAAKEAIDSLFGHNEIDYLKFVVDRMETNICVLGPIKKSLKSKLCNEVDNLYEDIADLCKRDLKRIDDSMDETEYQAGLQCIVDELDFDDLMAVPGVRGMLENHFHRDIIRKWKDDSEKNS